jgi:hypothetical protein
MARVKIKLNGAGYAAIRKDPKVMADLERRAKAIADRARANAGGGEFVVHSGNVGGNSMRSGRARVAVVTADYDAIRAEARTKALTRALDAGRS